MKYFAWYLFWLLFAVLNVHTFIDTDTGPWLRSVSIVAAILCVMTARDTIMKSK